MRAKRRLSLVRSVVIFAVPGLAVLLYASLVPVLLLFSVAAFVYELVRGRSNKVIFALYLLQLWWSSTWFIALDVPTTYMPQNDHVLKTISVVLPCSGEGVYARKTVQSIGETVPAHILHEVIVVDDNSHPPLGSTVLDEKFRQDHKVTILRQDTQQGLIRAKLIGGNHASGDIIVFFDCHVAPQPDWYIPFLKNINENYKRVIIPTITSLDLNTWRQIGMGGMSKCYLTFDADFKWFDSENDDAPALSGGLLGLSRRWWTETGGYDSNMYGWGGENIDQSLRIWLCGGEMKVAPDAKVAHMWRGNDEKTKAHYPVVGSSTKNRLRAAYGWMGPLAEKVKTDFPLGEYSGDLGDMSNIWKVRDTLKCKPFAYYLYRFRSIYIEGGLVPKKVFALKSGGGCLVFRGTAGTSGTGHGHIGLDRECKLTARHRFHAANRMAQQFKNLRADNSAGLDIAFSGVRAWNSDQCMDHVEDGSLVTNVCVIDGVNSSQQWRILNGKIMNAYLQQCLGVDGNSALVMLSCESASTWEMFDTFVPAEWKYYTKTMEDHPEIFV